ncbi:uncharacterized protein FYW49_010781 [Xenentodon cancila]
MPTTKANKKVKRLKGSKGRKDSKHESKLSKESDVETPGVNVALWELRLKAANQDLAEYRKANVDLGRANEQLTDQLFRVETSSVNKTGRCWKAAEAKDERIFMLEENLKRQVELALEEKSKLKMLELTINKNKAELKVINIKISKLMAKLASLEKALALKAGTLEQMKMKEEMDRFTIQASQVELARLKKVAIKREEEMQQVKQLVSSIVKLSKEPEKFFHEALEHVKQEIAASTLRSHPPGSEVQLTWAQKEQVLELLFAKMNGERERIREELCPVTISPQAPETILPSTPNRRPDEHTT